MTEDELVGWHHQLNAGLHSRLPRGVRPRLEGKPRTPLSSRVATRPAPTSPCLGTGVQRWGAPCSCPAACSGP